MRTLAALLAAAVLAALSGCAAGGTRGSGGSSGGFKGQAADVARVVNSLGQAASRRDAKGLCTTLLARQLVQQLNAAPGGCTNVLANQLRAVDVPTLKIRSIDVQGDRATAQVTSTVSGQPRQQTLALVREQQAWRIAGLMG